METRINIEAVEPKLYGTTEYVNVTKVIKWQPEIMKLANKYFTWMTMPTIPDEEWMCVYSHDWTNFVKWAMWSTMNPTINNI